MMEKLFLLAAVMLAMTPAYIRTVAAAPHPRVTVLATGGTIAGRGASPSDVTAYRAGVIGVDEMLAVVPEIQGVADVTGEQLCNIDSKDMNDELWQRLVVRVNELLTRDDVDGLVITHGTDTMEETAFLLSLTVDSKKTVVLTGAMLPATAQDADGPRNLVDAVRVAAAPEAAGKGVLVVMNGEIYAAKEAAKLHTTGVAAFTSPDAGPLGHIGTGSAVFDREPRCHKHPKFTFETPLPRVDILYGHEGDDGVLVEAAFRAGARGIVYAGLGNGSIPVETEKRLAKAAAAGVIVVRASRINGGAVVPADPSYTAAGFIDSGALNPQKARVLLRLALANTGDRGEIQKMFQE